MELPASAKGYTVHHKKMMQRRAVLVALAATVAAWQPATRISSRATPLKMSEQLTDEEEAEIIANAQKIAKKKRSNLYNEDGVLENPGFLDYRIPVASDLPFIDTVIIEVPNPLHPFGVKGVGEVPIVPPMPAIAEAVYQSTGVRFRDLPLNPTKIVAGLAGG